jgi:hypothetical protein
VWITLPILKNSHTGEVEEWDLNMAHCLFIEPYVFEPYDWSHDDLSVMREEAVKELKDSADRHERAYKPMKSCLRFACGTEAFIWYSTFEVQEIRKRMMKSQQISITPVGG